MPSPVAHSLLGLAIGTAWIFRVADPLLSVRRVLYRHRGLLFFSLVLANLPDLDFVPGILTGSFNAYHHGVTHSLGWILLAATGIWLIGKGCCPATPGSYFGMILLLLFSHLALDLITEDLSPPHGIMIAWPLSDRYRLSPWPVFWPLRKTTYAEMMQWHNVLAVMVELAWTLPVLIVTVWVTVKSRITDHSKI